MFSENSRRGISESRYTVPVDCVQAIACVLGGPLAVWEARWRAGLPTGDLSPGDLNSVDKLLQVYHGEATERESCAEYVSGESLA
jgi:hypothetical protein